MVLQKWQRALNVTERRHLQENKIRSMKKLKEAIEHQRDNNCLCWDCWWCYRKLEMKGHWPYEDLKRVVRV